MISKFYWTAGELAADLGKNRKFVGDMKKGGFRFPATLTEAIQFLKNNPHPTRFRKQNPKKVSKSLKKSHLAGFGG